MNGPLRTSLFSHVERAAWLVFCVISLHLVFLWPYCIIFPGQRANLFSGTLCAVSLCGALAVAARRSVATSRTEVAVSVGLLGLAGLSAWMNSSSADAVWRVFILMASGLGGFWGARILLNTEFRKRVFAWGCLVGLIGIAALSLRHYAETGTVDYFLYSRSHPLMQMLFLLSAGPIALLSRTRPLQSLLGVLVLVGMYITLYLIGVDDTRSAVLIPLAVLALLAIMASFGSRLVPAAFILMLLVSCVVAHYSTALTHRGLGQYQEYRLESYPFSWHVMKSYPVAGIGLRTPRDGFLRDYHVVQPDYPDDLFAREVRYLVTSENIFLTLMVGMGLPFLVLYGTALLTLMARLVRMVFRPPETAVFHPLALLLPLTASLLHALTTDVLLYPQVNWFFHVLLGLIPCRPAYALQPTVSWKVIVARAAAAITVIGLGGFVGTNLASFSEHLTAAGSPEAESVSSVSGAGSAGRTARRAEPSASLVVNIDGYKGSHINWNVMLIVDNSDSMVAEQPPWKPNRAQVASDLISQLPRVLPETARVAVRDFSSEAFGRKGNWEIPLRVSRLLCPWLEAPFSGLRDVVSHIDTVGKNDMCNAAVFSARADFRSDGNASGRLLLITDGSTGCSWKRMEYLRQHGNAGDDVKLDVFALGMAAASLEPYQKIARETEGEFISLDGPADAQSTLDRYGEALRRILPQAIELRGFTGRYGVMPGQEIKIPPGPYVIVLPPMDGLAPSKRKLAERIRVKPGESRTVTVSIQSEEPVVH